MSNNTETTNGPTDDWYWEKAVKKIGIGSRYHYAEREKIIPENQIADYLKSKAMSKRMGLFIVGSVGTGKTSILAYIAFHLAKIVRHTWMQRDPTDSEYWAARLPEYMRFITATALFNLFFGWQDKETMMRIEIYREIPVLMIDDLGREYRSDFPVSRFEEFIEYRYANELTTLVTSNISPQKLQEMVEFERIVDRFRDSKWMKLITITGKSQRE
jgi:DNA replication protein DnaC